jgi:hypothetical protein
MFQPRHYDIILNKIKQNRDLYDLLYNKMSFIIFFSRTTSFLFSYTNDDEKFYKCNNMYYFHDLSIYHIIELNEK